MKATEVRATKAQQMKSLADRVKLLRATERESNHAAAILAIDAAIVAAERPEQTVAQLITALETLPRVGVGHGGWSTLMQHMPGYGLPLQEAVARMAACIARMRLRTATQAVSAVQALLADGGDVRETSGFRDLCAVSSLLQQLETAPGCSRLRGLAASGLIDRVSSPPTHTHAARLLPAPHAEAVAVLTLSPHLCDVVISSSISGAGSSRRLGRRRHGARACCAREPEPAAPCGDGGPRAHELARG